jgi:hypothetical protein
LARALRSPRQCNKDEEKDHRRAGMHGRAACLALVMVSGCLGDDEPQTVVEDGPAVVDVPLVTLAVIDTGINPYNPQFHDDSALAFVHPSVYIEGYPSDAPALRLTLDGTDYESAVLADCDVWQNVTAHTLYWIPGTRIVGAVAGGGGDDEPCGDDGLPGAILDRGGHGTMTASRAAGADTGLCPTCRIVVVQGFSTANMLWAAGQSWIDLQSNSWGTLPVDYVLPAQDREEARAAAALHPVFVSAGNGVFGFFGGVGHPIWYDGNTGPLGIVAVGAHDGANPTLWGATMPHVIADGMYSPAAEHDSFEWNEREGGGTSGAAPFAAGAMARMLYELRVATNDLGHGARDGAFVAAGSDGAVADGLTLDEVKRIFFHTADARPDRDAFYDGPDCSVAEPSLTCQLYVTVPVPWSSVPEALPLYYFVGYGGVGNATWPDAVAVALGLLEEPARPTEDRFFMLDSMVRDGFDEWQPGG